MAKGLRSKSARRAKAVRREKVFGPVEEQRVLRLAAKLATGSEAATEMQVESISDSAEPTIKLDDRRGRSQSRNARSLSNSPMRMRSASAKSNKNEMDEDKVEDELDTPIDTSEALESMGKNERTRLFMNGNQFKKWKKSQSKIRRSKKNGHVGKK
ncbi:hypothetical protein BATDEDRAFT_91490 [Batrachochytrium dendrobatidis JAM81]|uniref:DUF2423 domain-containing protein n=1 Tax=Batrachochytrium dendrobatidis (strain JAM81 / FGSC 10211) TaxID=684364 RepID=F4PAW8_BATDJ|nr:uncharacterized protein BATDEDRAFT_91490 [Batrachochytrium dendrobatidis JAM81]EGF77755.1 hypothetical protein BATDEDRAFT_91490 [Batrachochytrium dendrobatidis JAM81]KAJ8323812.1 hypothetical protein O5D80_007697 [Batrachochytrium dendrobatidis]KAK5666270.1 hypothetical protein QVD99_007032 [Batrachochytrium dendrobatidis]|eukprot:XP_006681833.1 hypothetical protein BATDEDRAFT_91490 [Batrachochytrium dendrobatidis JAM81]